MQSVGVRGDGLWVPGLSLGTFRSLLACYSSLVTLPSLSGLFSTSSQLMSPSRCVFEKHKII